MGRKYGPDRGGPLLECPLPDPGDGSNAWVTPSSVKRQGTTEFGESTPGGMSMSASMARKGFEASEDNIPDPKAIDPHSPR